MEGYELETLEISIRKVKAMLLDTKVVPDNLVGSLENVVEAAEKHCEANGDYFTDF